MTTQATFSNIEGLYNAAKFADEIQDYVKMNPDKDIILYFPSPFGKFLEIQTPGNKIVVAGSSALWYLQQHVAAFRSFSGCQWKASDIDVFILGCSANDRFSMGPTDLVRAKETTVEQLLLNFDLGCCRVAYDFQMNFWVSLQCLNSIFKHWYPLPSYMKEKNSFTQLLRNSRKPGEYPEYGAESMMYTRFQERIKKYSNRGFGVRWINTETILPWVKNRFHYAEWYEGATAESSGVERSAARINQFADFLKATISPGTFNDENRSDAFPFSSVKVLSAELCNLTSN